MAINPKQGKLLYHLTSFDNLESILQFGLLPRNSIQFDFKDVADEEILNKRKKYDLGDYTPFHFFCATPFAGAVQSENKGSEFIYITITRGNAERNNFKIIPRHPLNYNEEPLDWNVGLDEINWELMEGRDYSNHACKEVCMAESIYNGRIKAKHFHCIYVRNKDVESKVVSLLKKHNLRIQVTTNTWMFKSND